MRPQYELKPVGTPLDGTSLLQANIYYDAGVNGLMLVFKSPSLADGLHHWRTRMEYDLATSPYQRFGPWIRMPFSGQQEANLRVREAVCPGNGAAIVAYGEGKPGTFGVPTLKGLGLPILGATAGIRVDGGLPGAPSILFLGASGLSIPFDGGTLLASPDVILNLPPFDADGRLDILAPLPDNPGMCGLSLFYQVLFFDPGASGGYGLALTNGLHRTFGS